jgi:DNA (cytosine-5)-methyltransferase 1
VNENPTHLDLFSGIGGFALAARWAGFETVGFCDNEPYAQAVLKKHWPNVPIHGDIKAIDGTAYRGVTLLTGGFPCQPFSCAGKQRGKDDDRYLWPQMLRVIQEARPAWIVGENVAGIINLELEKSCVDLEKIGYEVQPLVIPACSINAPHRRDRVWIIAGGGGDVANSLCNGVQGLRKQVGNSRKNVEGGQNREVYGIPSFERDPANNESISESFLGRVADGIPHRSHRLKGLGNAIVPQVAYQIIKGIRELL